MFSITIRLTPSRVLCGLEAPDYVRSLGLPDCNRIHWSINYYDTSATTTVPESSCDD